MPPCHICKLPCEREVEPRVGTAPAIIERDVWRVVARNGLHVDACASCWGLWPDDWKVFPAVGFGRSGQPPTEDEFLALMGGPA